MTARVRENSNTLSNDRVTQGQEQKQDRSKGRTPKRDGSFALGEHRPPTETTISHVVSRDGTVLQNVANPEARSDDTFADGEQQNNMPIIRRKTVLAFERLGSPRANFVDAIGRLCSPSAKLPSLFDVWPLDRLCSCLNVKPFKKMLSKDLQKFNQATHHLMHTGCYWYLHTYASLCM